MVPAVKKTVRSGKPSKPNYPGRKRGEAPIRSLALVCSSNLSVRYSIAYRCWWVRR